MKLQIVNELIRYQEIVDRYRCKGCLSNDYIYKEAADLIIHNLLYEYCGIDNAFLFVRKDKCFRVYYYLNNLTEQHRFDVDENLVVEILFRGSLGMPNKEIDYMKKCGFSPHLQRDLYCAIYKDLSPSVKTVFHVHKAQMQTEVIMACELFNKTFDHYSGDYISEQMIMSLESNGNILVATDEEGHFAGALHQTVEHGVAWVSHVAVLAEYRGKGIGQALLDAFIERNNVNENNRYMLWVQAQNDVAVKMYQKKGFKYMNKSTISMLKLK